MAARRTPKIMIRHGVIHHPERPEYAPVNIRATSARRHVADKDAGSPALPDADDLSLAWLLGWPAMGHVAIGRLGVRVGRDRRPPALKHLKIWRTPQSRPASPAPGPAKRTAAHPG
jgi:hypothetical protein